MLDVKELIGDLCEYDKEREWFEVKENWFKPVHNSNSQQTTAAVATF